MTQQRAIFLDRDGVINENRVDNVRTWEQFAFETDSLKALARLRESDFCILVITNQSGIGRGHMSQAAVEEIHRRMLEECGRAGGRIDKVYFCPHVPEDGCACRKPLPGMLVQGQREFGLDLANSYLVGDWVDDVRAARAVGIMALLVRTGRGERALGEMQAQEMELPPTLANLNEAVTWIMEREGTRQTATNLRSGLAMVNFPRRDNLR